MDLGRRDHVLGEEQGFPEGLGLGEELAGEVELFLLHQRVADLAAPSLDKGKGHGPANEDAVRAL